MEDLHSIFTQFKKEFPSVHEKCEELGQEIHTNAGPLSESTRWLLKIAISAAAGHRRALETHIAKARAAGVPEEEMKHALLLLISTCGFPTFMEAFDRLGAGT